MSQKGASLVVDVIVIFVLIVAAGSCGYALYRHRNREPINPTIARETKPPRPPRTGQFGDQSGYGPP